MPGNRKKGTDRIAVQTARCLMVYLSDKTDLFAVDQRFNFIFIIRSVRRIDGRRDDQRQIQFPGRLDGRQRAFFSTIRPTHNRYSPLVFSTYSNWEISIPL